MSDRENGTKCKASDIPGNGYNAWIAPSGTVYYVHAYGHCNAAEEMGDTSGGYVLEERGYLHLTGGNITGQSHLFTQAQVDAIGDIMAAVNSDDDGYSGERFLQAAQSFMAIMSASR